jgi:hypothetical protein
MRGKLFGIDELCLTKHALILNNTETERGKGWHLLTKGKIADFSAVLFHYKFTDDFYSRVEDAVRNEQYWNYSAEYKKYHSKLAGHDVLDLKDESSKTFNAMEDLIFNNFLVVSRDLEDFARHYKNG